MVGSLMGETSRGTDMLMGLVGDGTVGVVDREEYSVTGALWFAAVSLTTGTVIRDERDE
jgi:hypothetical protein